MKKAKLIVFLYKLCIVLSLTSLMLMFVIPILATIINFTDEDVIEFCVWMCFALFMLSGVIVLIVPFVINEEEAKAIDKLFSSKQRITKINANTRNFDEFLSNFNERLLLKGYKKTECYLKNQFDLHLYFKSLFRVNSSIFAVIYVHELTDEIVEMCATEIENYVKQFNAHLFNHTNVISVICVERLSYTFNKMMSDGVNQDFNKGRFLAGISFGGKKIYIAPPNHRFAELKYKKNKKTFLKCVSFLFSPRA